MFTTNASAMVSRRTVVLAAITFAFIVAIWHKSDLIPTTSSFCTNYSPPNEAAKSPQASKTKTTTPKVDASAKDTLSPQVSNYFDQIFSIDKPAPYDFPALKQQCEHTTWPEDDVYLQCGSMYAGLTSIISQVKVCLKMALEAGTHLVLPAMALRDSTDLKEFNFFNGEAHLTYEKWFDVEHLTEQLGRVCPQMKIIHPDQLDTPAYPVKNRWNIDCGDAPGYTYLSSYFWAGRPYKAFFDQQYAKLEQEAFLDPNRNDTQKGITVVTTASPFLIFRITDDPTGRELRLWNDLSHLIRFHEEPRQIIDQLLSQLTRPFYGVHFRVENDTIWSSLENQLSVDLDALDRAWAMYGSEFAQKPLVYLACGDQEQVEKFVSAGKLRGWDVTHKWQMAHGNKALLDMINALPFDFQGGVDMGIMIRSQFFLGITGSAFSSTVANARDVTGRYRGSSFTVFDDENARTHLFNDLDAATYACCL